MTIDRRTLLAGLAAAPFLPTAAQAQGRPAMTMWKDPSCGCCGAWAEQVERALGGRMRVVASPDMAAVKRSRGVPRDLESCHTAVIGGYVVEGHVPPADIRRLIDSRRRDVTGLAVPGMPLGSPGMEAGHHRQAYQVIAFGPRGRTVWARHG